MCTFVPGFSHSTVYEVLLCCYMYRLHLKNYAILPLIRLTSSMLPSENVSLESGLGYAELAEPERVE